MRAGDSLWAWEQRTYPWGNKVEIAPDYRVAITQALLRYFKLPVVGVLLNLRRSDAGYARTYQIELPGPSYGCRLQVILHEIAHLYAFEHFYESVFKGERPTPHGAEFKRALAKICAEARRMEPARRAMREAVIKVRANARKAAQRRQKAEARAAAAAARKAAQAAARQLPEAKLQRKLAHIARLERRIKALQTRLATAKRSARGLQQAAARREKQGKKAAQQQAAGGQA